jgi:uncharacterized damage-inducible protein DinB
MSPTLSHHFLTMAYNNAWANHRMYKAMSVLNQEELVAPRTGFFPSLKATLNHIVTVDWLYIDALEREMRGEAPHPDCKQFFRPQEPFTTCADLQGEQTLADRRLIDYCKLLSDPELTRYVTIVRPTWVQRDTRSRLLAHLLQHQIHHRGQAHAMLAGTGVAPPQLDEFFCEGESDLRAADFAELGWTEEAIWQREQ